MAGPLTLTGGCQCGAARYELAGDPQAIYVCHCRECRKQSASAFGISLIVAPGQLRLTRGTVQTWSRRTDSGRALDCVFCPTCGSRLWHANPALATLSVKGGSLDEPVGLTGAIHIWVSRKLPGVVIPAGAATFPEEPD
jgi:hypothetical protein